MPDTLPVRGLFHDLVCDVNPTSLFVKTPPRSPRAALPSTTVSFHSFTLPPWSYVPLRTFGVLELTHLRPIVGAANRIGVLLTCCSSRCCPGRVANRLLGTVVAPGRVVPVTRPARPASAGRSRPPCTTRPPWGSILASRCDDRFTCIPCHRTVERVGPRLGVCRCPARCAASWRTVPRRPSSRSSPAGSPSPPPRCTCSCPVSPLRWILQP